MSRAALLLLAVVLFASVASALKASIHDRAHFLAWKAKHHKSYASAAHETRAFANFRASLQRVQKAGKGFGVNQFSDLSAAEFKAQYLSGHVHAGIDETVAITSEKYDELKAAPATFSWLNYNPKVVSAVKDQGQCGSCWAFSATEALESQWFLQHNLTQVLAPQQVVSCDKVDQGCDGGDLPTAYAYLQTNGQETESSYPYKSGSSGETGTCKFVAKDVVATVTGFEYAIPPCNDTCKNQTGYIDTLKSLIAPGAAPIYGPPAICVNAAPWQDWTGPEPLKAHCGHAYGDMDHCVQLVGYNTTAAYGDYWIVRNSWASSWGQDGFIYVAESKNLCGILNEVVFPLVGKAPSAKHAAKKH